MPPSSPTVIWSPEAEQDLLDIWHYLATEAGPETADRQLRRIDAACRSVSEAPLRGRPRDELQPGLRSILAHPYVAFYRVGGDGLEIVRILHQRRDIGAVFAPR